MQTRNYFPLGIASGEAFCNREQETKLLVNNIGNGKHTLLMAPRRYGKSSLALRGVNLSGVPSVEVDFYMARSEKIIEAYILNGITDLIGKALGPVDKLISVIKRYVKNLKPKINIGANSIKLEFATDTESDPATNVKEGLSLLEHLLEERGKRAVLLLDEFQHVGLIAKGAGIEGAIRHVAQKTKYLALIFSGSNRRLLKSMFEDDTRPLYKLCWKVELSRIAPEHYHKHIQKVAQIAWKQKLSTAVIDEILLLTEKHPYYINKLCDRLLVYCTNSPPTIKEVGETWQIILAEEKSDAIKEISLLSSGQKTVLLQLAKDGEMHITGKQTMLAIQMTSSSILTVLEALQEKDIIEKEDKRYSIINPVIKFYVLKN